MKNKFTGWHMLSKYTFYGFLILILFAQFTLALDPQAQKYQSVKDIQMSIQLENARLEEAFRKIEAMTNLKFNYHKSDLNRSIRINYNASRATVAEILLHLSKEAGLRFKQVNGNINVNQVGNSGMLEENPLEILIQTRAIQGKVVSMEDNETLPGVNVVEKGTTNGTVTDLNGEFKLNVGPQAVLVFSSVGYVSEEVVVGERSVINMSLSADIQQLQELVVVGYGTKKKVNLTGAVDVATSERLQNRPIANAGEGLQGVIPNLNVTVRNGDPAAPIDFNVRGFESINGGAPLVLVDGVPMDLNRINPNDIKSISVLKDASAAAVYGARAAFGVVLVETKSGSEGKVRVSLNSQISAARPIFNMDPITDPHEFVLARNMANMRTNGVPTYDQDMIDGTLRWRENPTLENAWGVVDGDLRFYGFNDYQNQIMTEFAPTHQHDLTISGGNENSNFYVSLGHFSKDGYLQFNNEKFKRYNILMKGEFKVTDWLALDQKIVFNSQQSDKPHFYNWDVNINSLARVPPIQPIQFPDLPFYQTPGDREQYEQYIGMYFGGTNFFPYLQDGGRETFTNYDTWLTTGATLTPLKGLEIKTNFSYNIFQRNYQDVQSRVEIVDVDLNNANPVSFGFSGDDWIDNRVDHNQYYVFNLYGEYKMEQFENHFLSVMMGFNQEWGQNKFIRGRARSLITPSVPDLNATVGPQETFGSSSHTALRGVFYRVNYIFKDRYLFEANGRYDGTSRFPTDDRFGFFPSFSLGWRISEESFMDWSDTWLENLKIRASYGTLGNQLLGNDWYPYIATLGSGTSPYMMSGAGLIPVVRPAGLVSPTLTWETVVSRNIGLDFTMFNAKLETSFDVYTRDTKDMLMRIDYPGLLGTGAPRSNAADLRTSGWELSATWRDKINQDWKYDFTLALSDWTAEITKYENPSGALSEFYVGQRLGEIWGYETVGIFQSQEEVDDAPDQSRIGNNWRPGDIQYADLNGDGIISPGSNTLSDPGDRRVIGNNNPRWSFGINTGLSYKNFNFTTFWQGYWQRDHWPSDGNWTWFFPFNAGHVERYFLTDTWSETNRDAYFPAPHISTNDKKNLQRQSRFLQQAGYIRLKNIMLSYDLPNSLMEKIGFGSAQIYLVGMNIWEYSKIRKPLDPESITFDEFDYNNNGAIEYPMQRIYTVGARLSF